MNEPEQTPSQSSDAGMRVFAYGIYFCAFLPVAWFVVHWLASLVVPADRVAAVTDAIDLVGVIMIAIVLGLGFNYVVWKYVEDRWLRWLVFGIEGAVGAFIIYVMLIDPQPTPP